MFVSIKVNSWTQAKEIFAKRKIWVFRGQNDEAWYPESSLFRQAIRANYQLDRLHNRELQILKDFQRFAHHYITILPPESAVLDWLALLQHYGAPTRLVDFTYSFYVAAFFAVEKADTDAAIWAIDLDALNYFAEQSINYDKNGYFNDINLRNIEEFNKVFNESNENSFILHVQPNQMHERLWIQQGLFLTPTNPTQNFVENLSRALNIEKRSFYSDVPVEWSEVIENRLISIRSNSIFPNQITVAKLILPKQIHHEVIKDLYTMTISAATLFPGLDGFSRSMYYHLTKKAE